MTDPQRPLGQTPRRAEPLQPDKPGSGDSLQDDHSSPSEDPVAKADEQSSTAASNVRDGYK